MMSACLQAVPLAVEHVRNRREWMPVLRMNMAHGPANATQANAAGYLRILINVVVIVVVNEIVPQRLGENNPGDNREENADGRS